MILLSKSLCRELATPKNDFMLIKFALHVANGFATISSPPRKFFAQARCVVTISEVLRSFGRHVTLRARPGVLKLPDPFHTARAKGLAISWTEIANCACLGAPESGAESIVPALLRTPERSGFPPISGRRRRFSPRNFVAAAAALGTLDT
jgi:hypothetical protein